MIDPLVSEAAAQRAFQNVRRLYFAFLTAPVVALSIGEAMLTASPQFSGYAEMTGPTTTILTVFIYLLGLAGITAVLFLRRWCFQPHRFGSTGNLTTELAIRRLMLYQLLIFACAGSPAFLGLFQFFVTGLRPGSVDLVALGVLALVLARPRPDQWAELLQHLARLWPDVAPVMLK